MESYNQSFNEYSSSNDTHNEGIPVFATYLSIAVILLTDIIVVTPAVMVISVIWKTGELHTKYYFFVANLLATIAAYKIFRSFLQYLIMILYLLDLNSDSTETVLRWLIFPQYMILHSMTILLPITLAAERWIVIAFPYRHRSIMTKRTVAIILVVMWVLSAILTTIITVTLPADIFWPLALFCRHYIFYVLLVIPRLTSTFFIIATNVFLQYKITLSNRKAKENNRLGNEEEAKRFTKLVQMFQAQTKTTITLYLVGGLDVIANILIPIMYPTIAAAVEPDKQIYFWRFLMYPMKFCVFLSHALIYALCMKKIRKRLPNCIALCHNRQWTIRQNRVIILHRQS